MKYKNISNSIVYLSKAGSCIYGLSDEHSDTDYKGIFINKKEELYHISRKPEVYTTGSNLDTTDSQYENTDLEIFELKKFAALLLQNNPTIIELAFLNTNNIVYESPYISLLFENAYSFLTSRIKHTYIGYARQQHNKVELFRKRNLTLNKHIRKISGFKFTNKKHKEELLVLLKEEEPKPEQYKIKEYIPNLEDKHEFYAFMDLLILQLKDHFKHRFIRSELYDQLMEDVDYKGVFRDWIPENTTKSKLFTPDTKYISKLGAFNGYRKALNEYNELIQWVRNRNPNRAEIEALCGYDGKFMSHSLRLLKTGYEILSTGEVRVDRSGIDADYLIEIKRGRVDYSKILADMDLIHSNFKELKEQDYKVPIESKVKEKLNADMDSLLVDIYGDFYAN